MVSDVPSHGEKLLQLLLCNGCIGAVGPFFVSNQNAADPCMKVHVIIVGALRKQAAKVVPDEVRYHCAVRYG